MKEILGCCLRHALLGQALAVWPYYRFICVAETNTLTENQLRRQRGTPNSELQFIVLEKSKAGTQAASHIIATVKGKEKIKLPSLLVLGILS